MEHRPRPTRPGGQRESCLTFDPMRESGVLAYLASRHAAGMEDTPIPIDGRVDRDSAGRRLTNALWRIVLKVSIGEEMCFPLFLTVRIGVRPRASRH